MTLKFTGLRPSQLGFIGRADSDRAQDFLQGLRTLRLYLSRARELGPRQRDPRPGQPGTTTGIWNRDMHYRNRVFSTYQYVQVRTNYRQVQKMYIGTDQYIPVRTEYVPK